MTASRPDRPAACRAFALLAALASGLAQGAEVHGSLGASSDNAFRGISLSDEQPSLFGDLHAAGLAWSGGLAADTVRLAPRHLEAVQVVPYLAFQQPLTQALRVSGSLRHYDYLGDPDRNRYDYDEVAAALGWRDELTLQIIGSPDTYQASASHRYGRGAAFAAELAGDEPLPFGLEAQWGLGYYDLHQQVGAGYLYWSAALARQWSQWTLAVLYVGTDDTARYLFGASAARRWVLSALWSF